MMLTLRYKTWNIEPQSYQSDANLWRPRAVVSVSDAGSLHMHTVAAPTSVMCATEHDADTFAVRMAKRWIDERGQERATRSPMLSESK
jgi:hypothetical protein